MVQATLFDAVAETVWDKVAVAKAADLSPVERDVLSALTVPMAFGKRHIISTDDMQGIWRMCGSKVHDRRAVRAAIKTLLEVYDIPIGSSRTPGDNGYWFIQNDDEAEEATRHLKNEIMSLFRRIKVLSPKSAFVKQLQGQLALMEAEAADDPS